MCSQAVIFTIATLVGRFVGVTLGRILDVCLGGDQSQLVYHSAPGCRAHAANATGISTFVTYCTCTCSLYVSELVIEIRPHVGAAMVSYEIYHNYYIILNYLQGKY